MWIHFCHIALRAEPNFCLFLLVATKKKMKKIDHEAAKKKKKKKWAKNTLKKEFSHFSLLNI